MVSELCRNIERSQNNGSINLFTSLGMNLGFKIGKYSLLLTKSSEVSVLDRTFGISSVWLSVNHTITTKRLNRLS